MSHSKHPARVDFCEKCKIPKKIESFLNKKIHFGRELFKILNACGTWAQCPFLNFFCYFLSRNILNLQAV